MHNKILYHKDRIFVPKSNELQERLTQTLHEYPLVGHSGILRTKTAIERHYYWPEMKKLVERCVRNCHACRQAKALKDKYNSILQPLPILNQPQKDIAIDFVTGLLESDGSDAILMVIDRLTKIRHYIPYKAGDQGTSASQVTRMFVEHVQKIHELLDTIVSDRGTQFISVFQITLYELLQVKKKLSTAYHSQTDGQSEIVNKEMERYLRMYINYLQTD